MASEFHHHTLDRISGHRGKCRSGAESSFKP